MITSLQVQKMVQNFKLRNHLVIQIYHQSRTPLHNNHLKIHFHHVSHCKSQLETMVKTLMEATHHQKKNQRKRSSNWKNLIYQLLISIVTVMLGLTVYLIQWTWPIVSTMTNTIIEIRKSQRRDLLEMDFSTSE